MPTTPTPTPAPQGEPCVHGWTGPANSRPCGCAPTPVAGEAPVPTSPAGRTALWLAVCRALDARLGERAHSLQLDEQPCGGFHLRGPLQLRSLAMAALLDAGLDAGFLTSGCQPGEVWPGSAPVMVPAQVPPTGATPTPAPRQLPDEATRALLLAELRQVRGCASRLQHLARQPGPGGKAPTRVDAGYVAQEADQLQQLVRSLARVAGVEL